MKFRPRLLRRVGLRRGVQSPWRCSRTICTYTNSVMHGLHMTNNAAL